MPSNIRVYELARELGLSNKETIDLCEQLGIGVKSHSSSVVEAQADRVRRKAEREGLIRKDEPAADEPAEKPAASSKKAVSTKKPPPKKAAAKKAAAEPEAPAPSEADQPEAEAEAPAPEPAEAPPVPEPAPEPEPAAEPAADEQAPPPPPPSGPRRRITSSGSQGPPRPAAKAEPEPEPARAEPTPEPKPKAEAPPRPDAPPRGAPRPSPAQARKVAPVSTSGKPIPPPPPPVSRSGKPIPPPPGQARTRSGGGPGGPPGGGGGGGGARPPRGGGGGGGGRPPMGGPRQNVPGAGGRGRGGPQRPPRRRKGRRRRSREELQPMNVPTYTPTDAAVPQGQVVLERASTPQDLGPKLNRTAADVVRFLMQQGEMVTATQSLSDEMIELFATEIGAEVRLVDPGEEQEVELQKILDLPDEDERDEEKGEDRPPVITVMGHVDHGKTKLLDRIRDANVVEGEAGGITQHIGAYQVHRDGNTLTFIDTPGHEAFTAMRARGADATDIVILVVAADDGVMPQTVEALDHARAAEVPIVVAINKVDRPDANPDRVMQQLAERDLVPEAWGGDTVMLPVSALEGTGVDDLLDNLLVVAEVEDLKADPDGRAQGVVLEANLDTGRGPVATVLVQRGTLEVGDPLVAGPAWGRVRALVDDTGEQVEEAGPSRPVVVLGLNDVPDAGDEFVVAPDEKRARQVAEAREHFQRQAGLGRDAAVTTGARLEDLFEQIQAGEAATLNLILKADVTGSLEALTESLKKLERPDVKLSFIRRGVGGISNSDIQLAATSNATIIGFNVRPDRTARELADEEDVEIRTYEIIYQVLEDIENAMLGLLAPEYEEVVTGEAEVREIFRVPRIGAVAGCYVQNGTITRGSKVRFLREGVIIWKGSISSLKRFKDDVREVQAGYECGIGLSDFQDLKPGDVIETYDEREIPRT